jgi:hypothetical protein
MPRRCGRPVSSPGAGASAEVTVGAGIGANILVGGSYRTVELQPLSVQEQTSINVSRHRRDRAALRLLTLIHLSRRFFRAELDERFHGGNLISSDEIAYTLSTSEKMTPFTWPTPRRL